MTVQDRSTNSINGVPSLPLRNPQHPHHHVFPGPTQLLGWFRLWLRIPTFTIPVFPRPESAQPQPFLGFRRFTSIRRPIPQDIARSSWGSDASSQSGRLDSSMNMFRTSPNAFCDRDRHRRGCTRTHRWDEGPFAEIKDLFTPACPSTIWTLSIFPSFISSI
jgi:hypothetical protein